MIRVACMVLGPVSTNCYVLINEDSKEAVLVDPADHADQISSFIARNGLKPAAILLTHGHFDHIMAAAELRETYGIPVYACAKEQALLNSAKQNLAERFLRASYTMDADHYCQDGEELLLAGCRVKVLETPGHTPGGCCYYLADEAVLFSGDTLFRASIGRTDFEGGSYPEIVKSIREKLFVLPEETVCYPGHGEMTNIGYEKGHNPYVR